MSKKTQSPDPPAQDENTPVAVEATQAASPVALMYVGPTLRRPVPLQRGTVFQNGLPPALQQAAAANPGLAALFLPMKEAGKAMREMESGKGELARHARAVAKAAAKGDK